MNTCKGLHCPVRNACKRYVDYKGGDAFNKCTNQKRFVRHE